MALIDKETIRKEIERYKQGAAIARFDNAGENADYFQGKVDLCDDLTHILDTLPEQPVKGLEEELKRYINSDEYINTRESCLLLVARHFYELGCRHTAVMYDDIEYERQREEEAEITNNLEEEIARYLRDECSSDNEPSVSEIARHFAEWGAEHLKK